MRLLVAVAIALGVLATSCLSEGSSADREEARSRLRTLEGDPMASKSLLGLTFVSSTTNEGRPNQVGQSFDISIQRRFSYTGDSREVSRQLTSSAVEAGWAPRVSCLTAPNYVLRDKRRFGDWIGRLEVLVDPDDPTSGRVTVTLSADFPSEGEPSPESLEADDEADASCLGE